MFQPIVCHINEIFKYIFPSPVRSTFTNNVRSKVNNPSHSKSTQRIFIRFCGFTTSLAVDFSLYFAYMIYAWCTVLMLANANVPPRATHTECNGWKYRNNLTSRDFEISTFVFGESAKLKCYKILCFFSSVVSIFMARLATQIRFRNSWKLSGGFLRFGLFGCLWQWAVGKSLHGLIFCLSRNVMCSLVVTMCLGEFYINWRQIFFRHRICDNIDLKKRRTGRRREREREAYFHMCWE